MTHDKGLGRRHAPDERDCNHLLRSIAPAEAELPAFRHYRTGEVLDQGPMPHCVGFAWRQWLASAPMMTRIGPAPDMIYYAAQRIDEWPGEAYDGTSVRAGAKVLHALGHVARYVWAFDMDTVRRWILSGGGCVVVGTNWYQGMDTPDRFGRVQVTGRVVGGHAYLISGYNERRGLFTCVNSWGRAYGRFGRFDVSGEDMERLINENGEACTATEQVAANG